MFVTVNHTVELIRASGHRPAGERGKVVEILTNGAGRRLYAVRMADGMTCDLPRRYIRRVP